MMRLFVAGIFVWLVLGWPGDLTVKKVLAFSAILLASWPFLPPFNSVRAKILVAIGEAIGAALNCFIVSLIGMGVGALILLLRSEPFRFSNAVSGYATAVCMASLLNCYLRLAETADKRRLVLTTALCGLVITACAVGGTPMATLVGTAICIFLT